LKVAILSNDFRVYWKGRLIFLQPFLAENNIELQVIELFGKGSPYSFDSYNSQYNWWKCLFPKQSADELTKQIIAEQLILALNQINPDMVIASPITFFAGALGLRWAKKNQKKFIMFDDAKPLIQFKRNFLVQWVRNILASQADALWLPTDDYNSAYPVLKDKGVRFFYGFSCIDNNHFKLPGDKKLDHHKIICVARLVPIKNIDKLLQAWQFVEQHEQKYQLIIIGDGPEHAALNKLCTDLDLKRVSFVGFVDNSSIPRYYNNADAFILPSLSETWGLVVNEAMAAGLPVLLSNKINAAQSLLKEQVNGFSFDPFSVAEMGTAILKYITLDTVAKKAMSAQSLQIINEMGYEQMGAQLLEALPQIKAQPFKKTGIVANAIIKLWYGKHDTSAWDKL
jgi:glycosyltransferase involved in cell wall biosynthesis